MMADRWLAQQAPNGNNRYSMVQEIDDDQHLVALAKPKPSKEPKLAHNRNRMEDKSESRHMFSRNERLYEAYNDLHALAQDFKKPFDAPAILVVGHQTDGKSALVEALMGFQFNHVGGGTKTRRPITLHMKYNSQCVQPTCYLLTEEKGDQELSLEELREYIQIENARLEAEQQFWAKEIVVKIEYKFCPNLTIIDTPGLISAAPGKKNSGLQVAAKAVEAMVKGKMAQREYIILCLEDTNDWSNATTRRVVMAVDPTLSRTVVVNTKLDTRIPQFSTGNDVETFIKPPPAVLEPSMLGGCPFFTSVPSGRVGCGKDDVFRSDEQFREAVGNREALDALELESKMGRRLDQQERGHIGVGQLRRFLEQLLQKRYLENVPTIVPLLEKEYRHAQQRLATTQENLQDLHPDRLKDKGRGFRETFLAKLSLLLKGTVAAPADKFGETLADEHIRRGAFVGLDGKGMNVDGVAVPNGHMRLYGGAQFHRAMTEFRQVVGQLLCPDISREEIVNACGVDDFHDGVNYVRTACVIAVAKARDIFEPFLHQLGYRLAHVLRRMLPIAMFLMQRDGAFLSGHEVFIKRIGAAYHAFIDAVEKTCKSRCLEDLQSTTRYVTWGLHTGQHRGFKTMLSKVRVPDSLRPATGGKDSKQQQSKEGQLLADQQLLVEVLESTLWSRQLAAMSEEVVAALVCQIFEGIRDHIVQAAELKFNCFFLMPVVDEFPSKLREELELAYEEDLDEVFDVSAFRAALEQKLRSQEAELQQVERLQRKFSVIHATLAQQHAAAAPTRVVESDSLRVSMMSLTDSSASALHKLRSHKFAVSELDEDTKLLSDIDPQGTTLQQMLPAAAGMVAAGGRMQPPAMQLAAPSRHT